jgi:hypothetical protein
MAVFSAFPKDCILFRTRFHLIIPDGKKQFQRQGTASGDGRDPPAAERTNPSERIGEVPGGFQLPAGREYGMLVRINRIPEKRLRETE